MTDLTCIIVCVTCFEERDCVFLSKLRCEGQRSVLSLSDSCLLSQMFHITRLVYCMGSILGARGLDVAIAFKSFLFRLKCQKVNF